VIRCFPKSLLTRSFSEYCLHLSLSTPTHLLLRSSHLQWPTLRSPRLPRSLPVSCSSLSSLCFAHHWSYAVDFLMGGVSAVSICVLFLLALYSSIFQAVAKTSAAPIERIKLLVQNQDEMVSYLSLSYIYMLTRHALRSSKVVSPLLTRALVMLSAVPTVKRVSFLYGEETPPTSSVTSLPRL